MISQMNEILAFYKKINKANELLLENWERKEEVLRIFKNLEVEVLCHPKILSLFLSFVQLTDNESLINEYKLDDIAELLKLNMKLLPFEIDQIIELYHYYDNVIGNEEQAMFYKKMFQDRLNEIKTSI